MKGVFTLTKTYTHNNQQIKITITNHAIERILARNIPADQLVESIFNMLDNENYSKQFKKHIVKNITNNYSLVIKKDSIDHLIIITAMQGTSCIDKTANIITV